MDKRKVLLDRSQGFFILSGFPIVIGILGLIFYANYSKLANTPEPPLPPWEIADFPAVLGNNDLETRAYVVHCDRSSTLRVSFDARSSIKGWWAGSDAELSINGEMLPGTTNSDTWGSIITSQDVDAFTPWLEVTTVVDPKYYHTWLSADAKMNIVYPKSSGSTFTNKEENLEQRIQLLVITDEDLKMQESREKWKQAVSNSSPGLLKISAALLFLGILLIIAGFINLNRYRRLK